MDEKGIVTILTVRVSIIGLFISFHLPKSFSATPGLRLGNEVFDRVWGAVQPCIEICQHLDNRRVQGGLDPRSINQSHDTIPIEPHFSTTQFNYMICHGIFFSLLLAGRFTALMDSWASVTFQSIQRHLPMWKLQRRRDLSFQYL